MTIATCKQYFDMLMYADDTTSYCSVNKNITSEVIYGKLKKKNQWLGANKSSLNVTIRFFICEICRSVSYPDLQINDNKVERVTVFNFLGLVLQSNLS